MKADAKIAFLKSTLAALEAMDIGAAGLMIQFLAEHHNERVAEFQKEQAAKPAKPAKPNGKP